MKQLQKPHLIVSAWWPELRDLHDELEGTSQSLPLAAGKFRVGQKSGHVYLCTGIGSVAAASSVTDALRSHPQVKRVLFCATAGHYNAAVSFPQAFVCFEVLWTDAGVVQNQSYFPPRHEVALRIVSPLAEKDFTANALPAAGRCLSTPSITTDAKVAQKFKEHAELENLELYGVALAAQRLDVAWVGFLGVSNAVGTLAHEQWKRFHEEASACAQRALVQAAMPGGGS